MMQPMNYTIQTPGSDVLGEALQLKGQIEKNRLFEAQKLAEQQKMQEAQRQAELNEIKRQRFAEVAKNPTAKAVQSFMVEFPELSEQFKKSYDTLSDNEKRMATEVQFATKSAIESGKPDLAISDLDRRIEAAKNMGDTSAEEKLGVIRNLVIANPNAALLTANAFLAATMDPDKFATMEKTRGEERRAEEKQPFDVRKLKAETIVKEVDAQFAPDKIKAEFGLIRAQTNQANASAASSQASAEASRATAKRADAEAGQIRSGVIPADKRPEAEAKFRTEYNQRTAVFQDVQESYRRVEASQNDAAGDIAMIFGYMKMLDPGSVVREGEFATASNAAGIPTQIQNLYNKALSGQRLSEGQRKMFKGQAQALYKAAGEKEKEVRNGITRIAKGYGLNTENIFYTPEPAATTQPTAPATGTQLPGGFRVLGVER